MAFEAVSLLQHRVSMHLMVLGASRPGCPFNGLSVAANVSMHLMVLGAP